MNLSQNDTIAAIATGSGAGGIAIVRVSGDRAEDILGKIEAMGVEVTAVDALGLAEQAGTAKAANVVLMGVVSKKLSFDESVWQTALEQCVPAKFLELNKKAFALGREAVDNR